MDKSGLDQGVLALLKQSLSRKEAFEFKKTLKKQGLLSSSSKKTLPSSFLSGMSIQRMLDHYRTKNFVKKQLQKNLKKRLLSYENVGFANRKALWYQVSGAMLAQTLSPPYYYQSLRDKFKAIPDRFNELIDMDLCRTAYPSFPPDEFDTQLHSEKIAKCANILKTYVKRNPDFGYCQGLNYVVWELISRFEEEEAFWVLTVLVENYMPLDYYTSMNGVLVDQKIFGLFLTVCLPEIRKKFRDCSLDCSIFSIQWFVCLFCKTLNGSREIMDIVFDNLFIQGDVALFKIGLAILKWLKPNIVKSLDFSQLLKLMEQKVMSLKDGLKFQELINEFYISRKLIEIARNSIKDLEKNKYKGNKGESIEALSAKIRESEKNCEMENNFCLTVMELNLAKDEGQNNLGDFFVLKQDERVWHLINDYLSSEAKSSTISKNKIRKNLSFSSLNSFLEKDNIKQKDSLLIVRHTHLCSANLSKKLFKEGKNTTEKKPCHASLSPLHSPKTLSEPLTSNRESKTLSLETPSTESPLQIPEEKNDLNFLNAEAEMHDRDFRNSVMFLRKTGVFQDFDEKTLMKYWDYVKDSHLFDFNKNLIDFK